MLIVRSPTILAFTEWKKHQYIHFYDQNRRFWPFLGNFPQNLSNLRNFGSSSPLFIVAKRIVVYEDMTKNEFSQRRRKFSHFLGLNIGEILYFALFRGIFPNICSWEGSKIKISQNKLCHVFLYTKWHLKTLGNFWFSKKVHLSTRPPPIVRVEWKKE